MVNLSKCGRRQRKREEKERRKREAIQFVSVLAEEEEEEEKGRQCQRERERERETYFLLTGYVLEGRVFCSKCSFSPPPLQCKYEVFPFLCTLTRLSLFFFFYNNNCPPPHTQLLPIILKLVKTLNNK